MVFLGMVSASDGTHNQYWIINDMQSWESHNTACVMEGLSDRDHVYHLVKLGSL